MADIISEELQEAAETAQRDYVTIDGKVFDLSRPTAKQITGITRMLARMQIKARNELQGLKNVSTADYVFAFLANLDENDLLEVGALAIGSDKKFVNENFDLNWITEALAILVRNSNIDAVIRNFTSVLSPNQN